MLKFCANLDDNERMLRNMLSQGKPVCYRPPILLSIARGEIMPHTTKEVVDLINDPTCALLMKKDGVNPTEVYNMLRSIEPVVGRLHPHSYFTEVTEYWTGSPERRTMSR